MRTKKYSIELDGQEVSWYEVGERAMAIADFQHLARCQEYDVIELVDVIEDVVIGSYVARLVA